MPPACKPFTVVPSAKVRPGQRLFQGIITKKLTNKCSYLNRPPEQAMLSAWLALCLPSFFCLPCIALLLATSRRSL